MSELEDERVKKLESYKALSLNDFIAQTCLHKDLFAHRKRDRNIDGNVLDRELDEYIQNAGETSVGRQRRHEDTEEELLNRELDEYIKHAGVTQSKPIQRDGNRGKFDRPSMRDDTSDEEVDPKHFMIDSDVDMNDSVVRPSEYEDESEDLDGLLNFQTAETKHGIRVRSQQWRMLPENLVDRPRGVKRLEVLPLDENERYKRVRHGRVNKGYRSRNDSFSSAISAQTSKTSITTGKFVEKGSFTFKIGDRNGNGEDEGLIGIERAKHFKRPFIPRTQVPAPAVAPININLNLDGFFQGLTECVKTVQAPAPADDDSGLAVAAEKLLATLKAKRDAKKKQDMQTEISNIQGRPLIVQGQGNASDDDVDQARPRFQFNVRPF